MDRWDAVGAVGVLLVTVGVGELAGEAWSAIFVGVVLLALYIFREVRH